MKYIQRDLVKIQKLNLCYWKLKSYRISVTEKILISKGLNKFKKCKFFTSL